MNDCVYRSECTYFADSNHLLCNSYNCYKYYKEEPKECSTEQSEWTTKQWDYVKQLKAMVNHLHNKVVELEKQKPKRKYKFE